MKVRNSPWDAENVAIPGELADYGITEILDAVTMLGYVPRTPLYAIFACRENLPRKFTAACQKHESIVKLKTLFETVDDLPEHTDDLVDEKIEKTLWSIHNRFRSGTIPLPEFLLIIGGDFKYARIVRILRELGVKILLIYNKQSVSYDLLMASHYCTCIRRIVKPVAKGKLLWSKPENESSEYTGHVPGGPKKGPKKGPGRGGPKKGPGPGGPKKGPGPGPGGPKKGQSFKRIGFGVGNRRFGVGSRGGSRHVSLPLVRPEFHANCWAKKGVYFSVSVAEILKDCTSWFQDCRCVETLIPTGNGGTIELINTQLYAPTTLAPARDFWTLRYSTCLEDGSYVVCENSLTNATGGPNGLLSPNFMRAKMLSSGFLICPCDGGGSIIHTVDHADLDVSSVPEVLRPFYESSEILAQKITVAALRHARQISQETSGEVHGFNDAVNGFADDGWTSMSSDGGEDISIMINSFLPSFGSGVLCAKASMLLQNVPPLVLIRFLREHRAEWADYGNDAYAAASLRATPFAVPCVRSGGFPSNQVIVPLAQTLEHEEDLKVVRLGGHAGAQNCQSESRALLNETNEFVGGNVAYALAQCLEAIACVCETLEEREAGSSMGLVTTQTKAIGAT